MIGGTKLTTLEEDAMLKSLEELQTLFGVKELPGEPWQKKFLFELAQELEQKKGVDWLKQNSRRLVREWEYLANELL